MQYCKIGNAGRFDTAQAGPAVGSEGSIRTFGVHKVRVSHGDQAHHGRALGKQP